MSPTHQWCANHAKLDPDEDFWIVNMNKEKIKRYTAFLDDAHPNSQSLKTMATTNVTWRRGLNEVWGGNRHRWTCTDSWPTDKKNQNLFIWLKHALLTPAIKKECNRMTSVARAIKTRHKWSNVTRGFMGCLTCLGSLAVIQTRARFSKKKKILDRLFFVCSTLDVQDVSSVRPDWSLRVMTHFACN